MGDSFPLEETKTKIQNILEEPEIRFCGLIDSEGELNYVISKLLHNYTYKKGKCYKTLNEVQGVMTCASMEFYRKVVTPYEDEKIKQNGDL